MILFSSSFGGIGYLSFNNGLLLAYFSNLGIPSSNIIILLSLLPLSQFVFIVPSSYLSDIYGKKFIGSIGLVFCIFGFLLLMNANFFSEYYIIWILGIGIVVFGTGTAMNIGSWFALIHPIIPENIRGRFFGNLRFTWQSVGFIFTLLCIYILEWHHTLGMYQAIIGVITFFIALRLIFYQLIPELEKSSTKKGTFRKSFLKVLQFESHLRAKLFLCI